ncbi:MAG: hypothetical protein OCD02_00210 [Spirochaetaceae bacterium]
MIQRLNVSNLLALLMLLYCLFIPTFKLNALNFEKEAIDKIHVVFSNDYENGESYEFDIEGYAKDGFLYILTKSKETDYLPLMELDEGSYIISLISEGEIIEVFSLKLIDTFHRKSNNIFYENLNLTSVLRKHVIKVLTNKKQ